MRIDDTGRAWLNAHVVVRVPGMDGVEFDTCPLARFGARGCPSPDVPDWLPLMFDAASMLKQGGAMSDVVRNPAQPLVSGALEVMAVWDAVSARKAKDAAAIAKAKAGAR